MTITPPVEYREVDGFPGYRVGSDGSVLSCWRATGRGGVQVIGDSWKRLKGEARKQDRRLRYTLKRADGSYRRAYGSHFVLEAFVGPRPEGMECCHEDGDCLNDAANNLRWDTSASNKADMVRHGTNRVGERHPKAKLSDKEIADVLALRGRGEKLRIIAGMYGVTETRVYQICKKGGR